jgi:hypothetical protein
MSETLVREGWLLRIREARNSNANRVKMFKEMARLTTLQAPEDPDEYRLRTRVQGSDDDPSDRG